MTTIGELDDAASDKFTIAWICPTAPEWIAAKAAISVRTPNFEEPIDFTRPNDPNLYLGGKIGCHWVVLGCPEKMGQITALDLARSMRRAFPRIHDFLVVGIAGGMTSYAVGGQGQEPQPIVLGDVVISSQRPNGLLQAIKRVDQGRDTQEGVQPGYSNCTPPSLFFTAALRKFQQRPGTGSMGNPQSPLQPDVVTKVLACVQEAQTNELLAADPGAGLDYLMEASWTHQDGKDCEDVCMEHCKRREMRGAAAQRDANSPFVHLGSVASMDKFLANPLIRDERSVDGYLCVEMEAASVAEHFPTTTIRGIMDYCDTHRSHAALWRNYAAVTAAATARYLISLMAPSHSSNKYVAIAAMPDSRKRGLSAQHHYLDDMPDLCQHYQAQPAIDKAIQEFLESSDDLQNRKLLLHGLPGRGKTQSCVALMKSAAKSPLSRSRLLWVNAHSPRALFDSLQTLQENLEIPKRKQTDSSSSFSANMAKSIGNDVERWLSGQEHAWLMVLDHLVPGDNNEVNDDLSPNDLRVMLLALLKAKNGKIIITAHDVWDGWSEFEKSTKYAVTAMDQESALTLVRSYFHDRPFPASEKAAALSLCQYLDCLPAGISILCSLIRDRKDTIQSSVVGWPEVFDVQRSGAFIPTTTLSLNFSMKQAYNGLKKKSVTLDELRAVDLFKILACFDGSDISEAIFNRAWQAKAVARERPGERKLLKFFQGWSAASWGFQAHISKATKSTPKFLERFPGETHWQGSSARRQLRNALNILERLSFLEFSDDQDECIIKIPTFLHTWIRKRPYASTLLETNDLRHSWMQASFILAASLSPLDSDKSTGYRNSRAFSAFQRRAAAHIEQLRHLSNGLDSVTRVGPEVAAVMWNRDFPAFGEATAASLFADALDAHDYPQSALKLWEVTVPDENNIHTLVRSLVYADSLERNGYHVKALKCREAARLSICKLQVPDPLFESSEKFVPSPTRQKQFEKQLELVVDYDIAKSNIRLGHSGEASKILESVVVELENIQQALENSKDEYLSVDDAFRLFISEARIDKARCLMYAHHYQEAHELIEHVLVIDASALKDGDSRQKLRLSAIAVRADIMFARGQHASARHERKILLRFYEKIDPEMRSLDNLVAQEKYANSLSAFHEYADSLALREKVQMRLNVLAPLGHELIHQSQHNLAKCKMANADAYWFDKRKRKHHGEGPNLMVSAANLVQQVWITRRHQDREGWGLTRSETLDSLALMIECERVVRNFGRTSGIEFMSQSAMQETDAMISPGLADEAPDVRSAWYRAQLEDCLVDDLDRRKTKLQAFNDQLCRAADTLVVQEAKLEIEFHVAMANLDPFWMMNRTERYARKDEPQFKNAAEALEDVWLKRKELLGPENRVSEATLASVVETYKIMEDKRYWPRAKDWCMLLRDLYGDKSSRATNALEILQRRRNDYRLEPVCWANLEDMTIPEFAT